MWYVVVLLCSTPVYGGVSLIDSIVTPICVPIHYVTQFYINYVLVWSCNVCPHTMHCVSQYIVVAVIPWHTVLGKVALCWVLACSGRARCAVLSPMSSWSFGAHGAPPGFPCPQQTPVEHLSWSSVPVPWIYKYTLSVRNYTYIQYL